MFRKKTFWIVLIVLALLGGGGYAAYARGLIPWFGPEEPVGEEATLQTAQVTVGDLSITADGSGVLVPSSQIELAFDASGTLMELLVKVGDVVQAGDVLAWIDDTDARNAVVEAELSLLQAQEALENAADTASMELAVAQAELQVAQKEADLDAAGEDLDELLNWAPDKTGVEVAEVDLTTAQVSYQNTVAKANMQDGQNASTRIKLEEAIADLQDAQASYANAMDAARDWERNIESARENATRSLKRAQDSLEVAQVSYDLAMIDSNDTDVQSARVRVLSAQEALDDLKTPPDDREMRTARLQVQELAVAVQQARLDLANAQEALTEVDTAQQELSLQQAELKLESAREALGGTTLIAPASGTVIEVNTEVGEKVNGTVIVLADLAAPVVQFWVEESDLNSVALGHRVNLVFEALPDLTYSGEIVRVDPVLVSVGNTPAVQAWASIDVGAHPVKLLGDMNVEVEIVAGEALNALLVPVAALRELGTDRYAVFVVQDDGELEMRMVEVGLMDYVNAEIRSGLQRGEVVSTGERTTSSSSQSTTDTEQDAPPPGMMRFFGG
ncbi:MAG: HlyD family efflux transporter periplasmic adaptor subunit [Anaerolineae bacterium]|nr:HlyD family efflux transporter periplasmic adaptor subunit [Anaerolineae bacterium]